MKKSKYTIAKLASEHVAGRENCYLIDSKFLKKTKSAGSLLEADWDSLYEKTVKRNGIYCGYVQSWTDTVDKTPDEYGAEGEFGYGNAILDAAFTPSWKQDPVRPASASSHFVADCGEDDLTEAEAKAWIEGLAAALEEFAPKEVELTEYDQRRWMDMYQSEGREGVLPLGYMANVVLSEQKAARKWATKCDAFGNDSTRFMSMLEPCSIIIDGIEYGSVKTAYCAMISAYKVLHRDRSATRPTKRETAKGWHKVRAQYASLDGVAAGRLLRRLKENRNVDKIAAMKAVVFARYEQNIEDAVKLLNTEGTICAYNHWGDSFWGRAKTTKAILQDDGEIKIIVEDSDHESDNNYGKILTMVRESLKQSGEFFFYEDSWHAEPQNIAKAFYEANLAWSYEPEFSYDIIAKSSAEEQATASISFVERWNKAHFEDDDTDSSELTYADIVDIMCNR